MDEETWIVLRFICFGTVAVVAFVGFLAAISETTSARKDTEKKLTNRGITLNDLKDFDQEEFGEVIGESDKVRYYLTPEEYMDGSIDLGTKGIVFRFYTPRNPGGLTLIAMVFITHTTLHKNIFSIPLAQIKEVVLEGDKGFILRTEGEESYRLDFQSADDDRDTWVAEIKKAIMANKSMAVSTLPALAPGNTD